MKKIFFGFFWLALAQITNAQTNTVTGLVHDEKGNALHYVFVGDNQYRNGAYSDLNGNFTMEIHQDSKLHLELAGYKDTLVSVDKNNPNPGFILRTSGGSSFNNSTTKKNSDDNKTELQRNDDNGIAGIPVHEKGNQHGSKYLLGDFTYGFFINSSDALVHNKAYWLNYDKIDGLLLLTEDGKTINELSWDKTKSFTLFDNKDQVLVFEKLPAVDNLHYFQLLSSGKKYKIYKFIKTKFVRADFVNNGVTSHGNDYDEYVDDPDYYVTDAVGNQPKKLALKKKSIKDVFAADKDKADKFLSANPGNINDAYLSNLGLYMNQ